MATKYVSHIFDDNTAPDGLTQKCFEIFQKDQGVVEH